MTSHLVLSLYYRSHAPPNAPGVGEGLRGVVWILSAKSARCTVKMVGEEWPVGRGEVKTLVVVSSVTRMVTSGGDI